MTGEASDSDAAASPTTERSGCSRMGCGIGLVATLLIGLMIWQPLMLEESLCRFGPTSFRRKLLGRLERSERLRRAFVIELVFDRDAEIADWAVFTLVTGRLALTRKDVSAGELEMARGAIIDLIRHPALRLQDAGHGLALLLGPERAGPEVCETIYQEAFKVLSRPTGELRSRQAKALAQLNSERIPAMIRGLGPSHELAMRIDEELVVVLRRRLLESMNSEDPNLREFGYGLLMRTAALEPSWLPAFSKAERAALRRCFKRDQDAPGLGPRVREARALKEFSEP